ncbi:hypothetical protein [Massilia timonae]|uniref:hypothetical protein n=1 Tax=Massilia timonae TaxID=47229 RepID=UPI00289D46C9|nr:hypothetical protein [Massilia timonae]
MDIEGHAANCDSCAEHRQRVPGQRRQVPGNASSGPADHSHAKCGDALSVRRYGRMTGAKLLLQSLALCDKPGFLGCEIGDVSPEHADPFHEVPRCPFHGPLFAGCWAAFFDDFYNRAQTNRSQNRAGRNACKGVVDIVPEILVKQGQDVCHA